MKRFFIFVVACCISAFAAAQGAGGWTVGGLVTDEASGEAVEFANVVLHSAADDAVAGFSATDSKGAYSLKCARKGDYYLTVTFVGYETFKSAAFSLAEGNRAFRHDGIALRPSGLELAEVEVTGKKRQIVYKLDKKVIETAGNIAASGGTAIDLLSQTPSVKVDADGEVTFRGSSGFKVYIDGKPSTVGGSAALDQIPAEHIENIEIITTPSARNEADGIAGIINVVTKKQLQNGWSGMLNVKASTVGTRGVDFLASYRKNGVTWQTSGEAARRQRKSKFDQTRNVHTDTITANTHSYGARESYIDTWYLRSGLSWDKGNTTWSASVEGRYGVRNRGGGLNYEDNYTFDNPVYAPVRNTYRGGDFVNLDEWSVRADVGFDHRFADKKGHTLTGSFYAYRDGDAMEFFYTDLFNGDGSRAKGHRAEEAEYRFTAQGNLDYVNPLNARGGKFEAGYYYYSYTEDGDYNIWMYNPASSAESKFGAGFQWRDDLYTKYLFRRDVHALYAILSNVHGKFSYQLGLREEYRYRKLGSSREWAQHVWNDFDLFPSVHTAYDLNSGGRLNLSYSRRVTQPALFYMEPYVVYVDYSTAQCGNPKILPEYINSYEFTWSKGFGNHSASGTLFHRTRFDKIERLRVPYHHETGVVLDSMANVGNDYSTGAEMATSFQLRKWWSLDVNGSLFDYRVKNDVKVNGADAQSLNWQLTLNNNFDIGKSTRVRLEGYYVGPSVSTQGRVNEFFYFNFSLRQQFLDKKMTATLNFRDILSTSEYVREDMYSRTAIQPHYPSIMLSVSYLFNNFKTKNGSERADHDMFEGSNR